MATTIVHDTSAAEDESWMDDLIPAMCQTPPSDEDYAHEPELYAAQLDAWGTPPYADACADCGQPRAGEQIWGELFCWHCLAAAAEVERSASWPQQ